MNRNIITILILGAYFIAGIAMAISFRSYSRFRFSITAGQSKVMCRLNNSSSHLWSGRGRTEIDKVKS